MTQTTQEGKEKMYTTDGSTNWNIFSAKVLLWPEVFENNQLSMLEKAKGAAL